MISICKEFWQLVLCQAVGIGIAMSFLFVPVYSAVAQRFKQSESLAIGVTLAGGSLGGVVLPILLNNLIDKIGFQWAVRVEAFLALVMLAAANVLLQSLDIQDKVSTEEESTHTSSFRDLVRDRLYVATVAG